MLRSAIIVDRGGYIGAITARDQMFNLTIRNFLSVYRADCNCSKTIDNRC
jgi:hypothetical protein